MTRPDETTRAHADPSWLIEELRKLPSRNIGRLLEPALARVLDDDELPNDRNALRLGGIVLSERKRRRKAA